MSVLPAAWKALSLQTYLVAVILLSSVPIALVLSYEVFGGVRAQQHLLDDASQRGAQAAAQSVGRGLARAADALAAVARRGQDGDIDAELMRLLDQHKAWLGVFAFDGAGRLVVDSTGRMNAAPQDRDALYAQTSAASGVPFTASPLMSIDAHPATAVMVAAPGTRVVGAWVDTALWQRLLDSSALPPGGHLALTDQQGRLIARSPANGASAVASGSDMEAPSFVRAVPASTWKVAAGARSDGMAALGATRAFIVAIATTGGCMLLGLWLGMTLARRVTRPLGQLSSGASELARMRSPIVEVERLRDRLIAAHQQEAHARAQLRNKVVDFQALFDSCPIGLAFAQSHDGDLAITYNPAMQALLGPVEGSAAIVMHADGAPLAVDGWPVHRAARDGETVGPLELQVERPGLPTLILLAQAVPLRDIQGRPRGAIGAAVDITQRKEDEARLRGANRAMDEFLAMLGHELRNPLGAMSAAVEVLQRVDAGSPVAARSLAVVSRQSAKLGRITNELLDTARVISGNIPLVRQPMDLGALAGRTLAGLRAAGEAARHRLVERLDAVWVEADAMRIEQIIHNLVTNAFAYTPPGTDVEVTVQRDGAEAVLHVRDHGPGIPADLIDRVFDLFVQGEQPLARERGGLGVGLTLVRRLAALHAGSASVRSLADGSIFEVRLPAIDGASPPAGAEVPASPPRGTIVIVDEGEALAAQLGGQGYAVRCTDDDAFALEWLQTDPPDAAIVALHGNGSEGCAFARRCRAAGYPGFMLAAVDGDVPADAQLTLRAGFDASLPMPIDPARLRELMARYA